MYRDDCVRVTLFVHGMKPMRFGWWCPGFIFIADDIHFACTSGVDILVPPSATTKMI